MRNLTKDFKSNRPILIQPAQADEFLKRVANVEIPLGAKMADMGEILSAMFGEKETIQKFPPYAIIPIKGVIGKNLTEFEKLCGCCDIDDVEEMLEDAERDQNIKCIILDIDSPGGVSVGVPELANRVKNCSKDVISFTCVEACSAAYWIGSQANKGFFATPSSTVGSVGVYIAYEDFSEWYANEGIKVDVIKAGVYKATGVPGTSLTDEQRKMLFDEVIDIWNDFKTAVKSVREFVDDASMEGQCFSGKRGAEAGLVTGLVNGFDELMELIAPDVASQMEAAEENEENENEETESGEMENNDSKSKYMTKKMSASERALMGIKLENEGYPAQPEDRKVEPKLEEAVGEGDVDEKNEIVVSDFDGTISNDDGSLNEKVADHLKRMDADGKPVHVVTGRVESKRGETEQYLTDNKIPFKAVHMKADDSEDTAKYKLETVKKIEADSGASIKHILENDETCTKTYSDAGYKCFHPDAFNGDKCDPDNPDYDPEDPDCDGYESKAEANEEADTGKKPIETDEKAKRGDMKKHR
jgi:signal peptide peptidase SppA